MPATRSGPSAASAGTTGSSAPQALRSPTPRCPASDGYWPGAHDPALTTLDAAHRGKLPDAFADARRYLLESRTAGHLYEEILAQTLLGDVLAAAGQPAPAVCVYVMAGQAGKAATLAAGLPGIIDMTGWLPSGLRRRRAAAIQVTGAQSALVCDDDVPGVVGSLLSAAQGVWVAPFRQPHPERDALKAIASFGVRIPEATVDQILSVAAPALSQATAISDTVVDLLIQSYWAVETRRADLAAALTRMLRLPDPPYNLWGFVTGLPPAARGPILPTVQDLGENGDQEAIAALASWVEAPAMVQLAARRACAAFLRRPVGVTQTTISVGTEEETVVHLVIALLDVGDLCEVPIGELTPEKARPAGGVMFTSIFGPSNDGAQPSQTVGSSADASAPDHDDSRADGEETEFPDTAAIQAAGAPPALAIAIARHLTAIGGDTCAGAGPRANALSALRRLLPKLPPLVLDELFPRLLAVSQEPGLSEADQFELSMDTGLSRSRIQTGANILGGLALVAAVEAFAAIRDPARPAGDADRAAADKVIAQAVTLMRDPADDETSNRLLGALSIAAIARSAPDFKPYATGLLFSGDEQARALGATYTPGSPDMFRALADDPSPKVRTAVASRAPELPDDVGDRLAEDAHAHVRNAARTA